MIIVSVEFLIQKNFFFSKENWIHQGIIEQSNKERTIRIVKARPLKSEGEGQW